MVSILIAVCLVVVSETLSDQGPANAACSPTDDYLDCVSSAYCSTGDMRDYCNMQYLGPLFAR